MRMHTANCENYQTTDEHFEAIKPPHGAPLLLDHKGGSTSSNPLTYPSTLVLQFVEVF
jgi:hypothetical protein